MKEKVISELIDECGRLLETIPTEQLSVWSMFANVNSIASQYDNVDCLIHVNFTNGRANQGICILTDWKPGALALQSDDGDIPKLRLIYPEEYVEFMEKMERIFDVQYPTFPDSQNE